MKIREMREAAQRPQRNNDGFYTRHVARFFSIYLTRILVATGLTANTVTGLMMVAGLCAALLFTSVSLLHRVAGALVMQFWFILDCCDGEVARLRKSSSLTGLYMDYLVHYTVHPCMIFFLGIGLFRAGDDGSVLILAFSATMAVLLADIVEDCRYKAVYLEGVRSKPASKPAGQSPPPPGRGRVSPLRGTIQRVIVFFCSLYYLFKFPAVMNLMCAGIVLDWSMVMPSISWSKLVLLFIGTAGHLHWASIAAATIYYRETERSYSILGGTGRADREKSSRR